MDEIFGIGSRVRMNRGVLAQFHGVVVEIDRSRGMATVEFNVYGRLAVVPIPLMRLEHVGLELTVTT